MMNCDVMRLFSQALVRRLRADVGEMTAPSGVIVPIVRNNGLEERQVPMVCITIDRLERYGIDVDAWLCECFVEPVAQVDEGSDFAAEIGAKVAAAFVALGRDGGVNLEGFLMSEIKEDATDTVVADDAISYTTRMVFDVSYVGTAG